MGKDRFTSVALISLSLLLVAGSIFFLFAIEPERERATSDDGIVTIEGYTRESQAFAIETLSPAEGSVFVGNEYLIKPAEIILESPATLSFVVHPTTEAVSQTLYRFDEDFDMWEVVSPIVQQDLNRITVEVDRLGLFSLGKARSMVSANFLADRDELISMAPDNTVGFELATAIQEDGHLIKLENETSIGGCAGIVEHGSGVEQSQIERDARLYINDVETQVVLVFSARWFVNELGGCGEGVYLEAK